jgi:hypothetical protein
VTKLQLGVILFAPVAAIAIGTIALYLTFKIDKHMFSDMELDFDTVDF